MDKKVDKEKADRAYSLSVVFVSIKDELITGKDRLRYYKVMGS